MAREINRLTATAELWMFKQMNGIDDLYRSWSLKDSYFHRMIHCGDYYNQWIEYALHYLPRHVLEECKEKLTFISTGHLDGCRLAPALRKNREIIVLSERILPKQRASEIDREVRYFIYVVLHEVAHVVKKHRTPTFDNITTQENDLQEREADELALRWFNEHVVAENNPYLLPLTKEEREQAQTRNRELMDNAYTQPDRGLKRT